MKKILSISPKLVAYFFILLFCYAAVSKIMDFENFQVQIAQSPLLSAYAGFISYAVIIVELLICTLLTFPTLRLLGLYASLGMMSAFTVYIYLILNYSEFVPCSCGGILEKMGWTEHLIFNIFCVILAVFAILVLYYSQYKANYSNITKDEMNHTQRVKTRSYLWLTAKLCLTTLLSSAIVVALFLSSEHIIKKENHFTRRFLPHPIDFPQQLNLNVNSFYFAGQYGDTIFLGNKMAPLIMAKVYPSFDKMILDTLKLNDTSFAFQELKLHVQYPYFSLSDGHVPVIFEGKFPDLYTQVTMQGKAYFSKILMIIPHHYIFSGQSTQTKETIMGLLQTNMGQAYKISFNTSFLEKQIDGIFDTDGNFVKDPVNQQVIYTYFYRNQYKIMDYNLNFIGQGKTIDTTSRAQIKLTHLKDGRTKMTSPPIKVNQDQAAYNGYLFNEAQLRGRQESAKMWQQAKIIDVYHYPTSSYQYSFYIHHDGQNKMRSMLVTAKYFYILIGNQMIRYQRIR